MRRAWTVRWWLMLVALLASVALPAAPASATSASDLVFLGTMNLNSSLDWACPATLLKCVTTVPGLTTKGGPKGVPIVNVAPTAGNNAGFTLGTTACFQVEATAGKPKAPVNGGACAIGAAGSIAGFCNLATAAFTGTIFGPGGQAFVFGGKFTMFGPPGPPGPPAAAGVPTAVVITGTATKMQGGAHGWVVGVATATAVPVTTLPGGAVFNNCSNKTAITFTVAGKLKVVIKNIP